eukprot:TRINITY_DN13785_c0_g1_i1.p1 TRINITY_DN13785_c0_g1~~TRINITY_DN13785_c0_g1_i1.p1  ORF type:complete len:139 (+),score=5.26 TRINITY_DN13785_c0_g1_i1:206-622(+)
MKCIPVKILAEDYGWNVRTWSDVAYLVDYHPEIWHNVQQAHLYLGFTTDEWTELRIIKHKYRNLEIHTRHNPDILARFIEEFPPTTIKANMALRKCLSYYRSIYPSYYLTILLFTDNALYLIYIIHIKTNCLFLFLST